MQRSPPDFCYLVIRNRLACKMESTNKTDKTEPPKDTFKIIYILFFLLGVLHMLPWYFFNTATAYWMYKFRDTSSNNTDAEDRTDLQAEFSSVTDTTLTISNIIFMFLSIILAHKIGVKTRLLFVLATILALFLVITVFVEINTDSCKRQNGFFAVTMLIVAAINGINALFTITMYTTVACFPESYLAPYLMGQGLSRLFSALLQILSLTFGLSVMNSAMVYFGSGDFIIGATLIVFIIGLNTNFFSYHMKNLSREKDEEIITFSEVFRLLMKVYPCIVIGIFVTLQLSLIPTALVVSVNENDSDWNKYYFIPTITYFLEAACALIGRGLVFKLKLNFSNNVWMLISFLCLVVFVPLIVFSNAQPRHHLPVVFQEDYQYIIIEILNGLTFGYLSNIMVINIRTLCDEDELKRAYHIYITALGVANAVFSPLGVVSVKLL